MNDTSVSTAPTPSSLDTILERLRQKREAGPLHYDKAQNIWEVFGYAEAQRVMSDAALFSSDFSNLLPAQSDFDQFAKGNFVRMDPPKHRKLRGLVSQAFTPRVVANLAPRISALTTELLDHLGGAARFDLVDALAYPLPVIVIAELLGIPVEDRALFRKWADALFSRENQGPVIPDEATLEAFAQPIREMNNYLLARIRQHRARPADDLISRLVAAEVDGERLDDQEIVGFAGLLLIAGHITTTALLSNSILCFDEHPEAAAALRNDPGGLPTAIEEVLRYRTPFPRIARRATAEVKFDGHVIRKDQILILWLASANRDSRQFTEPDRFDIRRKPNPHLAFGHGIHFCLGAPLARLEAKIALEILLGRYREIKVARDEPIEFHNPWMMFSAKRLPVDVVTA